MEKYEIIVRLLVAMFVGGVIGYEREYKHRPAELRTHSLVCIGAAIISMIQILISQDAINIINSNIALKEVLKVDLARLGAQVITGVGFLGAGTIIHEKGSVKGLTTAASIWIVACIGLAIGMGYYFLSIVSSIVVFLVLVSFEKIEKKYIDKTIKIKIEVKYVDREAAMSALYKVLADKDIEILNVECKYKEECNKNTEYCIYYVLIPPYINILNLIIELSAFKEFIGIRII